MNSIKLTLLLSVLLLYGFLNISTAQWVQMANGISNNYGYSLAINGNNIFAGNSDGVYLSTNNGTIWTQTSLNDHYVS